jgi:predicted ribosome quality control (RQC) complex YloA/Tae2 family protein
MSSTRITCPNCGRSTIRGKFCIYCGYTLEPVTPVGEIAEEVVKPEEPAEIVSTPTVETKPVEPTPPVEEAPVEEKRLVDQLANMYTWWFRLVDLFLNREADAEIFSELHKEYKSRLDALNQKREDEIRKVEERINELNRNLEKLKVEHEIGKVPDRVYITQKLEIDREMSRLRPKLGVLQNPFGLKLGDLPNFKNQLEERLNRVRSSLAGFGLPSDVGDELVREMEKALKMLEVLMSQHRKISRELEKLEIRYKIGELKQSEYLSQKQKLERQLELTAGSV